LLIFSLLAASSALAQHEAHVLPKTQLVKSRQSIIDNWIIGQPVGTTSGLVDGHPAPNATLVSEYLGIPYAEPPVGNLRFQPPVKYNGTSVVDATDFGNSCINTIPPKEANQTYLQEISATPFGLSLANGSLFTPQTQNQSEDCLTLNIWTKPQTGQPNKAVLIYIHSSSASSYSNSSSSPFNNPQWLVNDQDVIVVTFNYRVGIFGYPGNPVSSPNLGLLDVRLAIEWVRDNIAEFGGDPSRITLFGHGTGASIADSYSFALPWVDDPIVQAFILMSGTAVAYEPLDNRTAWENWFNTTEKLGCGGARDNRTEVWQCMLGLDAKDIADAAASLSVAGDLGEVASFRPTVDDTLIFGNYTDRKPIPAPVLVGNTDDEAGIYKLTSPGRTNESWEQVNRLQFGCPAAWRAGVNARNGNPTWRYRYFASFPNLRLFESSGGNGPWHGSDILLLFNHTPVNWLPNTAQEIAFGKYFRGAWAAFAHDPFTGLSGYTAPNINTQPWPQYNLTDRLSTIIRLGWHNQLGPNL
ncbi:carboxylesterase, partial [Naviculisporaceae sp. PSN 640]